MERIQLFFEPSFEGEQEIIFERVFALVNRLRPNASLEHQREFARLVVFLVIGLEKPTREKGVRETTVIRLYKSLAGSFSEKKAIRFLLQPNGLVFGSVRRVHFDVWCGKEVFFGTAKADVDELSFTTAENWTRHGRRKKL